MIVVRIELHRARQGGVIEIGKMLIGNVGGTSTHGDYEVKVLRRNEQELEDVPVEFEEWKAPTTRMGEVRAFPRLSYNVWRLVARALLSAFPEESKR